MHRLYCLLIMMTIGCIAGCSPAQRTAEKQKEGAGHAGAKQESAGALLVDGITGRKHVDSLHHARASIKEVETQQQARFNKLEKQIAE
jgi:hypothetical protein